MKKVLFIVTAAIGLVVGASSASAAVQYPPPETPWVSTPGTVGPGAQATFRVGNAIAGETVRLTLNGATYQATADSSGASNPSATTSYGSAIFTVTAPSAAGTYPVTVSLATSGVTLNTSLTVTQTSGPTTTTGDGGGGSGATTTTMAKKPGGKLPATGGGGTGGLVFAGALLAGGAALVFVSKRRKATI